MVVGDRSFLRISFRLGLSIFCQIRLATKFSSPKTSFKSSAEIVNFVVINTDENHAVLPKQIPRKIEPRIQHHIEPVGCESVPMRFPVLTLKVLLAAFTKLTCEFEVVLDVVLEVVGIDEVLAGVVKADQCK